MLRYVKDESLVGSGSEISYSSSELAFYHTMAESANAHLQRQILRESQVTKCVLKSRRKLETPRANGDSGSVPPLNKHNSLSPRITVTAAADDTNSTLAMEVEEPSARDTIVVRNLTDSAVVKSSFIGAGASSNQELSPTYG
jgi:hypothetical protein